MQKRYFLLILLIVLSTSILAQEEIPPDIQSDDSNILAEDQENIYEDIGQVNIQEEAGLTPDSPFYFLDSLFEKMLVGSNPQKALSYKEEKIAEAKEMINQEKPEQAQIALEKTQEYSTILQNEVSPELEQRARQSSKASKEVLEDLKPNLQGEEWGNIRTLVNKQQTKEDQIALAAKLSSKIKELCQTLSQLDPLEYSNACKTDDDAPDWQKELDKELTNEQKEEAEQFFEILSGCFENPNECRCSDITIKPFAEKCSVIAPLAAKCEEGDEEACDQMDEMPDPIELLPPHLQEAMHAVENRFRESEFENHIPKECKEQGATSQEACFKIMFQLNAPPECQEAFEQGEINPKNENEARSQCEEIMFKANAPEECIEAGLKDHRECEKFMFKQEAPEVCLKAGLTGENRNDHKKCNVLRFKEEADEACLKAGLTGEGRDDWRKCDIIRFKQDAPEECLSAGITGEGRDDWKKCEVIRFKAEAPQECIDAGIDPTSRDAGQKCQIIQFKANAPEFCIKAGITGEKRDDWKRCDALRFENEAPEVCQNAGIDSKDPRAWDKCSQLQFKQDAPDYCVSAGLSGTPKDWEKCEKLRWNHEADSRCKEAGLTGDNRNDWRECEKITRQADDDLRKQEEQQRENERQEREIREEDRSQENQNNQ